MDALYNPRTDTITLKLTPEVAQMLRVFLSNGRTELWSRALWRSPDNFILKYDLALTEAGVYQDAYQRMNMYNRYVDVDM